MKECRFLFEGLVKTGIVYDTEAIKETPAVIFSDSKLRLQVNFLQQVSLFIDLTEKPNLQRFYWFRKQLTEKNMMSS